MNERNIKTNQSKSKQKKSKTKIKEIADIPGGPFLPGGGGGGGGPPPGGGGIPASIAYKESK